MGGDEQHTTAAPRRVIKIRRDYKAWVADETLEDYALRYAARSFRKWPVFRVANTAFGAVSFLAIEAIGATMALKYGFINTFWAALAVTAIVFLTGLPIAWYAAKYNLDMDLLSRGAGFGYLGSTITSLIYASFTFLLFAIEAAIMAQALNLYLHVPLTFAYLISAFVVIPLVSYGITFLNRLQSWTQPIWLVLLVLPYIFVFSREPDLLHQLTEFGPHAGQFNLLAFGAATSVALAFIVQIGEQVDFLRFMPERDSAAGKHWTAGVLIAGPGWIALGTLKLLGGALLAYLALRAGFDAAQAGQPAVMYAVGFGFGIDSQSLIAVLVLLFVVVSQIKINVANAYAGSLAWSNFFARVTHSHPGRIVWLVFNVLIAFMLMEMGIFDALGHVLGLYSNIAISWVGALVADLVINKPLGLSPRGIQFMRAHLYDINPVGTGALVIASVLSIAAFSGMFGPVAEAFSAFIALGTALITAPLIAWLTRGRYYLARQPAHPPGGVARCVVCEKEYETDDMAQCPAYRGSICSLCCTLDARCHDLCRPGASFADQYLVTVRRLLPNALSARVNTRLGYYLMLISSAALLFAAVLTLFYVQQSDSGMGAQALSGLRTVLLELYLAFMVLFGVGAWWLVLTVESRYVAQDESNRQTHLLMNEIAAHEKTDAQLQTSIQAAERANQAKTRYLTGISHELRTPLNSILGYAQIVEHDPKVPNERREAMKVIRRSGEHMVSLLDGLLDISKIEAGKLSIDAQEIRLPQFIGQLADMFRLQASAKGIAFEYETQGTLPARVRVDKKRLGQILINILGNAVKFTERGGVTFRVFYRSEMTRFEVEDTGIGFTEEDRQRIFLPFERGANAARHAGSSAGLGLTIAGMLATLMGGELTAHHSASGGSLFRLRLYLPEVHGAEMAPSAAPSHIVGYAGPVRRLLLADDEWVDREFMRSVLEPLGFELEQAGSGVEALRKAAGLRPDLILLDLNMPDLNGWETAQLLRSNRVSEAPILIISADVQEIGRGNTAGIGAHDFIPKPVDVDMLLARIANKLKLEWTLRTRAPETPSPTNASLAPAPLDILPDAGLIERLHGLGVVGDIQGILGALTAVEDDHPELALFVDRLRSHIENFRLDEYLQSLERAGEQHAARS
ncbi:ATP-binding protein [Acidihalobacter ferrooxydans]|uniref:histidine kinase n=1 Tax=Acidihalobacter ferrooxydans TaxID=1765967 RepID=A0A1P8UKG6_9GAMM|nr:ATP-binding protein [Acidihalobacter ferrooxydans]APZ44331.1 hybrid sensor histidine kinase/response regulator [Acidihalobacter ferrooxydans]